MSGQHDVSWYGLPLLRVFASVAVVVGPGVMCSRRPSCSYLGNQTVI